MNELKIAQQQGVVRGLKGLPNDTPVPRLEIDELIDKNPDAFNLFLLALEKLQTEDAREDVMGYYQIAGIHGLPKTFWDDIQPEKADDQKKRTGGWGYCAHGTPTFPPWHRPYLALFEQTLYYTMSELVKKFPADKQPRYLKALETFRLPYWDYFKPRYTRETEFHGITKTGGKTSFPFDFSLPRIFTEDTIMVRRPENDQLVKMPQNPLKAFAFPKGTGSITTDDWKETSQRATRSDPQGRVWKFATDHTQRHPRGTAEEITEELRANAILNANRESAVTNILDMVAGAGRSDPYDSYATFASAAVTAGASGNLEDLHGNYHVIVGGFGGHMSHVPVAAFDPVFWMHHCQIDRYFAIWQAAHPDKWFDGQYYVRLPGQRQSVIREVAPLATEKAYPFRHAPGNNEFWNGNLSRDTKTFGYVYQDAVGSSPQAVKENFKAKYMWLTREAPDKMPDSKKIPPGMAPVDVSNAQFFRTGPVATLAESARMAPQAVLSAMQTVTSVVVPPANANALVADVSAAAAAVDTNPVAPGAAATEIAFTNLTPAMAATTPASVDEKNYKRDWYIDQIVERLGLNQSFTVFYFIGAFDNDAVHDYAIQPTLAALNHNFTSSIELCDNCGGTYEERQLISGTNAITPILLDYVKIGVLPDISPANVVPFLISNLKWRVVTVNGEPVNTRDVPGFKVGLSSKLAPLPDVEGAPAFEEYPQVIEQIINNSS